MHRIIYPIFQTFLWIFSLSVVAQDEDLANLDMDKERSEVRIYGEVELTSDVKIVANKILVEGDARIYTNGFNITLIAREIEFKNTYSVPIPGTERKRDNVVERDFERISKSLELVPQTSRFESQRGLRLLSWNGIFPHQKKVLTDKLALHLERKKYAHLIVDSLSNPKGFQIKPSTIKLITLRLRGTPIVVTAQERQGSEYVLRGRGNGSFMNVAPLVKDTFTTVYLETLELEEDYRRIGRYLTDEIELLPGLTLRLFANDVQEFLGAYQLRFIYHFAKRIADTIPTDKDDFDEADKRELPAYLGTFYADREYRHLQANFQYLLRESAKSYQQLMLAKKYRDLISPEMKEYFEKALFPSHQIGEAKAKEPSELPRDPDTRFGDYPQHQQKLRELAQAIESTVAAIERQFPDDVINYHEKIKERIGIVTKARDVNFARSLLPQEFYDRDPDWDLFRGFFSLKEHTNDFTRLLSFNSPLDIGQDISFVRFFCQRLDSQNFSDGRARADLDNIGLTTSYKIFSPLKIELKWNEKRK